MKSLKLFEGVLHRGGVTEEELCGLVLCSCRDHRAAKGGRHNRGLLLRGAARLVGGGQGRSENGELPRTPLREPAVHDGNSL